MQWSEAEARAEGEKRALPFGPKWAAVPGKSRLTGYAATTTGAGMDFDEEACASLSEFTT